jgi:hypothetical protein
MGHTGSKGFQDAKAIGPRRVMVKAALFTLALVLGATAVHAADACYQGIGGNILVFKKFKMPRAGDCTPIQGFQHNSECTVSGTACGTSDGFLVKYNFDLICHSHPFGTYAFDTDRSILQGDGVFCQVNTADGQYSCPTSIVSRVTCPAPETLTDN